MSIIEKISVINELRAFLTVTADNAQKLADRASSAQLNVVAIGMQGMGHLCKQLAKLIDDVEKKVAESL